MNYRKADVNKAFVASWTVLIVDDTPDNLLLAKTALEFYSAKVYTARNGEEGLDVLKTVRPTVILLDIRMPKMDGWAMYKLLRQTPELADIPIIAITAYAMDTDRTEILDMGFDGYISKPFDIFTFVSEIEGFVKKTLHKQGKSEDTST